MSTPIEIIVNVHGGVVQDVFCSDAEAQVTIVDWDTEGASPDDRGIVSFKTAEGKELLTHVDRSKPSPLSKLAGTDVESALRAAGHTVENEPFGWRYVLYDFDADELATTQLYGDYAAACEDANELNNVLILAVAIGDDDTDEDLDEGEDEDQDEGQDEGQDEDGD